MSYVPSIGSHLVVRLPGEIMRCVVESVVDANRVIIEIDAVPMSRSHQYRQGDKTGARRKVEHGRDVWEALDDRDFIANRSPTEPAVVAEVDSPTPKRGKTK
jgi:hypothetical protein